MVKTVVRSAAEIQAEIDRLQQELVTNLKTEVDAVNQHWEPLGWTLVQKVTVSRKAKGTSGQISPADLAARKEKVKAWFATVLKGGPKTIDELKTAFEKVKESMGMKNFPKLNAYGDAVKVAGEKVSLKA